jgi:hypothetical protein
VDEEKKNFTKKLRRYFEKYPDEYSRAREEIKRERDRETLELYKEYIIEMQKEV